VHLPAAGAVAELVRLPAVLSVPGDVLLGAVAAGRGREAARTAGLTASSSCLYLAGMALNDYADRDVDAVERPGRPIPSQRVTPGFALGLAGGLTASGAVLALAADGRRGLALAVPLAASVWAYDLVLKQTPAGPGSMSACRGLDVLLGAGLHRRALGPAAVVAAHTAAVTTVSRNEVEGGAPSVARRAFAATAAVATVGALLNRGASLPRRIATALLLGAYAAVVGGAYRDAAQVPSPERMRRAVGTGVLGLMPLEAGMLAGAGGIAPAGAVASLWPVARSLSRRRSVT